MSRHMTNDCRQCAMARVDNNQGRREWATAKLGRRLKTKVIKVYGTCEYLIA